MITFQPWPESSADRLMREKLHLGFAELQATSLLACTATPCDLERIRHLWQTVRMLSGLPCKRIQILILSNARSMGHIRVFSEALAPVSRDFSVRIFPAIEDVRALPWMHKAILEKEFPEGGYDMFLYLEDDMTVTAANLAYWAAFVKPLSKLGRLPSFVRCEFDAPTWSLHALDPVCTQVLQTNELINVDGTDFAAPVFPYCAMYVLNQELALEHISSPSFTEPGSATAVTWGPIERANIGLMFQSVPPNSTSRYVVPVDRSNARVMPPAIVHHTPDKYVKEPTVHSKLPLAQMFAM